VSVVRQIGEQLFGACERAFGVDNPFDPTQRAMCISKAAGSARGASSLKKRSLPARWAAWSLSRNRRR
jgi:hypothetical protein